MWAYPVRVQLAELPGSRDNLSNAAPDPIRMNPAQDRCPFDHQDWVFELKHDGFQCRGLYREWRLPPDLQETDSVQGLRRVSPGIGRTQVKEAILDGEIVCLGADGRSQFRDLMHGNARTLAFYAFDLLWMDGEDLRPLPLIERKRSLRRLIRGHAGLLFAQPDSGQWRRAI